MVEGRRPEDDRPDNAELPQDTPPDTDGGTLADEPGHEERLVGSPEEPGPEPQAMPPEVAAATSAGGQPAARDDVPQPASVPAPPSRRRLMRSRDHHVLGGVAGGIAERTDTDAGLIRVLFVLLAIFTAGLAVLVYVVLWISMPLEPPAGRAERAGAYEERAGADNGRMGGLILGLLLVLAGVVWLLQATDAVEVDWNVALAIALIGVGALLVLTLGSVARGSLVSLGVLLTLVLVVVSLVDINFDSSFGNRSEEPASVADLEDEYSHSFGSMTLDLRSLDLPQGTTEVKANTAFGSLEVLLPPGVPVRVEARTTFGSVDALEREANGLRADRVVRTEDYESAARRINLEVSATFGSVEVRR